MDTFVNINFKRNTKISLAIVALSFVLSEVEKIGTTEKILEDPVKTAKQVAVGSVIGFAFWLVRRPNEEKAEEIEKDGDGSETHL